MTLNAGTDARLGVYEAYASTDLMGYASVTAGRQALDYGSGDDCWLLTNGVQTDILGMALLLDLILIWLM